MIHTCNIINFTRHSIYADDLEWW